jgi:hypothetical protein
MVPSLSVATRVTVEFTATSGAGLFHPLQRPDGTGLVFTVTSGPGVAVCVLPKLPTSYGRVAFANSQTQVATLTLLPLRG